MEDAERQTLRLGACPSISRALTTNNTEIFIESLKPCIKVMSHKSKNWQENGQPLRVFCMTASPYPGKQEALWGKLALTSALGCISLSYRTPCQRCFALTSTAVMSDLLSFVLLFIAGVFAVRADELGRLQHALHQRRNRAGSSLRVVL